MTCTRFHALAFVLAVAAAAGTFSAANALARQQYVVAERVVLASVAPAGHPSVPAIGHRSAEAS